MGTGGAVLAATIIHSRRETFVGSRPVLQGLLIYDPHEVTLLVFIPHIPILVTRRTDAELSRRLSIRSKVLPHFFFVSACKIMSNLSVVLACEDEVVSFSFTISRTALTTKRTYCILDQHCIGVTVVTGSFRCLLLFMKHEAVCYIHGKSCTSLSQGQESHHRCHFFSLLRKRGKEIIWTYREIGLFAIGMVSSLILRGCSRGIIRVSRAHEIFPAVVLALFMGVRVS